MPRIAKAYIAFVIASGAAVLLIAAGSWSSGSIRHFAIYLGFVALASTLKVRIPGLNGTMSPNFVLLLIGITSFSLAEVIVCACAAAVVQSIWRPKQRLQLIQILFSAAALILSSSTAFVLSHLVVRWIGTNSSLALVILAGSFYLSLNTALVSLVISLVEGHPLKQVCQRCYEWVFPYFLGGIILTALFGGSQAGGNPWQAPLLLLPAMVLGYLYALGRSRRTREMETSVVEYEERKLVPVSSYDR